MTPAIWMKFTGANGRAEVRERRGQGREGGIRGIDRDRGGEGKWRREGRKWVPWVAFLLHLRPLSNFCIFRPLLSFIHSI